jgi:hypothetical protein
MTPSSDGPEQQAYRLRRGVPSPAVAIASLVLAANVLAVLSADVLAVTLAGLVLWSAVPGWLLAAVALPRLPDDDPTERSVMAAGLGLALLIVGGLVVHYLPGPIRPPLVLCAADLLILLLWALVRWRRADLGTSSPRGVLLPVVLVLAAALVLRLPALGYSELQGDEATILLKAAAAVQGRADALFIHKKGPAEIVVPAVFYGLTGSTSEGAARLPFALAMCLGLLAFYQLGRSLYGVRVGLVGALLLAVNGFFVGFGRIVQYQSFVFVFSVLAVLAALRTRQDRWPRRNMALSVGFLTAGMLAHYDALFAAPAVLFLWLSRWRQRPSALRGDARTFGASAVAGLLLLGAFYVPMAAHPYFRSATLPYLFGVRVTGSGSLLHDSLANSAALASFYNSTYYLLLLAVPLLLVLMRWIARSWPSWAGGALAAAAGAAAVMLVARPEAWTIGGVNLALGALMVLVVLVMAGKSPTEADRAAFLWFAGGFVFYATLVSSPRTHFHVAFPAWSLLAAASLALGYRALRRSLFRAAAVVGLGALLAVSAAYVAVVFVGHDVEYRRVFPAEQPAGFWMPIRTLPSSGWFGFPYRVGWKAVGELYRTGVLAGTYGSNEEETVTAWYTRGAPRCNQGPRYYIIADAVQDVRPVPADLAAAGYAEIIRVESGGRERLRVFERDAPPAAVSVVRLEDLEASFDRNSGAGFEPGLPYFRDLGTAGKPMGVDLAGVARLERYLVEPSMAVPGGEVVVTLYWRALAPMGKDYSVFAHLVPVAEGAAQIAQSDGAPGWCGDLRPTSTWSPGEVVLDRRALRVPADAASGTYTLRVGMYDYQTLERLTTTGAAGGAAQDQVLLGTVQVEGSRP